MITLHAIVATVPDSSTLMILQNSKTLENLVWSSTTSQLYQTLLEQVQELDSESATIKVLPYYATIKHPTGRVSTLYRIKGREVKIRKPAGTEKEPNGLTIAAIRKSTGKAKWRKEFVKECKSLGFEDLDSLETRSNREFLKLLSTYNKLPCDHLKLVAVPAELEVRLTKNRHGEYIQEVGRVWV